MSCPFLVKVLPVQAIFLTPEPVRSITPWPFLKDSIFTWTFSLYLGRQAATSSNQECGSGSFGLSFACNCHCVGFPGCSSLLVEQSTGFPSCFKGFLWVSLKTFGLPSCFAAVSFPLCFAEIFPCRILRGFLSGFHFNSLQMFWISSCCAGVSW